MKLLEGIQLHELVLIILGFILGLVLIFVFLFGSLRGNTNLKLLYGFIAPLIMIGYPSIKSIEFSKDVVKIDKLVQKVNQNPTDTLATQALIDEISTLSRSRSITSSDAMTTIANAQAAVGMYDSAKVTIQRAIAINPKSDRALESSKDIQEKWEMQERFERKVERLKNNITRLNANPKDKSLRDSVAMNLNDIKRLNPPIHVSQHDILAVGMAAAIVGERQAAEQVVEDVLRVSPNQPEAKKLEKELRNKEIEKRYPPHVPAKPQQKPQAQASPNTNPSDRIKMENTLPKPPVVDAPVAVKIDTSRWLKLIPKTGIDNFVKWDKEN